MAFADRHPAWCAGYGRAGEWLALGASMAGPGHVRRYRGRDDAFALMAAGGYLVAAVADGVGGELYSRIGAAHCANAVCREILRQVCVPHVRRYGVDDYDMTTLPGELAKRGVSRATPALGPERGIGNVPADWNSSGTFRWNWEPYRRSYPTDLYEDDDPPPAAPRLIVATENAFGAARASLATFCAGLRMKMKSCTTTLLVVAMDVRSGEAVLAQLGDGAILEMDTMGIAIRASPRTPEDNPYTMALENWREGLVLAEAVARPGGGWVILTDGGFDFFPEAGLSFRAVLAEPGDPARKSLELLRWLEGLSKQDCEDDRTAVVVTNSGRLDSEVVPAD